MLVSSPFPFPYALTRFALCAAGGPSCPAPSVSGLQICIVGTLAAGSEFCVLCFVLCPRVFVVCVCVVCLWMVDIAFCAAALLSQWPSQWPMRKKCFPVPHPLSSSCLRPSCPPARPALLPPASCSPLHPPPSPLLPPPLLLTSHPFPFPSSCAGHSCAAHGRTSTCEAERLQDGLRRPWTAIVRPGWP